MLRTSAPITGNSRLGYLRAIELYEFREALMWQLLDVAELAAFDGHAVARLRLQFVTYPLLGC